MDNEKWMKFEEMANCITIHTEEGNTYKMTNVEKKGKGWSVLTNNVGVVLHQRGKKFWMIEGKKKTRLNVSQVFNTITASLQSSNA